MVAKAIVVILRRTMRPVRSAYVFALLSVAFSSVVAIAGTALLVPIALYVPVFGPPSHANVPEVPIVPLVAGVALGIGSTVLGTRTSFVTAAVRGFMVGLGAALYAGLVRAAVVLFHDPYFATPYRVYALLMVAALTATAAWWLWRVVRGDIVVQEPRLLAWPILAVIGATTLVTVVSGDLAPGATAFVAAVAGIAISERRWRIPARIDERRSVIAVVLLTFAFRAVFGLQTLARLGSGTAFAAASDDGPSYFDHASAVYADPGAIPGVLAANDGFPPAYSLFMAGVFTLTRGSLAAVVILQAAVAMAGAVFLYLIARRLGGPSVGLLAAALYATEQNIIQVTSTLTPESILVPTLLFGLWALERYRESASVRWLAGAAVATGLAFVARNNVGGVLLAAAGGWLVMIGRDRPRWAVGGIGALVLSVLVFSLPIAVVTGVAEGKPRVTNQLVAVTYEVAGNDSITIENAFLIRRGINPFRDLGGSLQRFAADPLPVLAFFTTAVPQRASTFLFRAPSGAADPVAIVSSTQYANTYGQLLELLLVLALGISAARVITTRPWRQLPLVGLLLAYAAVYMALFTFVFAPSHAFRYRIPVEPIIFIAQSAGLVALARFGRAVWVAMPEPSSRDSR